MAISKPRNRTVLFRLTQEEYDTLQNACSSNEARSLSDYARDRILRDASEPSSLAQIEAKLHELTASVERLTRLLDGSAERDDQAAAA